MTSSYIRMYGKGVVFKNVFRFKRFALEDSFLIFGDPRGGTTWLMELFSSIPNTLPVSEPLHLTGGCLNPNLNFGWRQHIPKDQTWEDARINFEQILSGKRISTTSLRPATFYQMFSARQLLIKFARGNSLLPWLANNFTLNYSPIYLLRHPIAVASSQIHNFPETAVFQSIEVPNQPYNRLFKENLEILKACKTRLEQLVVLWCIHNCMTLQDENVKWQKIYYEDLILKPEETLLQVFQTWGISLPKEVLQKLNKPSYSDFKNTFNLDKEKQLNKWQNQLSENELENLQKILHYFHIEDYTAFESIPII